MMKPLELITAGAIGLAATGAVGGRNAMRLLGASITASVFRLILLRRIRRRWIRVLIRLVQYTLLPMVILVKVAYCGGKLVMPFQSLWG
jgi:hypothetical protein